MMSRQVRRLILAAVLVGSVLAICGCSSGEDPADAGQTASTAAFRSGSVVVEGLVDYPMTLTSLDMDYMNWSSGTAEHPDQGMIEYEGVRLSEIFAYVGVRSGATTLEITSADGTSVDLALEDLAPGDATLAVAEDGTLSMVVPGMRSDAWVADVVAMEFK